MFACQIAGEVVAMCFYDGFAVLVVSHAVFGPLGGGGGHEGTNAQQWKEKMVLHEWGGSGGGGGGWGGRGAR
jgi:hypothetical protein